MFKFGKPSISIGHLYHSYDQRVPTAMPRAFPQGRTERRRQRPGPEMGLSKINKSIESIQIWSTMLSNLEEKK